MKVLCLVGSLILVAIMYLSDWYETKRRYDETVKRLEIERLQIERQQK